MHPSSLYAHQLPRKIPVVKSANDIRCIFFKISKCFLLKSDAKSIAIAYEKQREKPT